MTQTKPPSDLQQLYEQDFAQWIEATVNCLKAKDTENLDWDHLIEEIEDLGKSQRRELENRLDVLLAHLLKRCYVAMPDCYRGWQMTIQEQRNVLRRLLKQSPSLKNYFEEGFDQVYQDAVAAVKAGYPETQFPETWHFSRDIDAILAEEFWEQ